MPSVEVGFVSIDMVFPLHFSSRSTICNYIDWPLSLNAKEKATKAIRTIIIEMNFVYMEDLYKMMIYYY